MSVEVTDRAARARVDTAATEGQPLGDVCAGCRELAERIDRLEGLLARQIDGVAHPTLHTTSCYWICVGVHAFVTLSLFTNEIGIQLGMLVLAGAVGTLAVCHVLSTRPIHLKILRTILSTGIVVASAFAGISLAGFDSSNETLAAVCLCFPFLFGSAWLATKMFVWTRGWRLIAPNGPSEFPKLRIWHLLFLTFIVAVYLAVSRWLITDADEVLGVETLAMVSFITLPTAVFTAFSCALARIILRPKTPRTFRHVVLFTTSALVASACAWTLALLLMGGVGSLVEFARGLLLYVPLTTIGVLSSPCFTFLMLRLAKYRMAVPENSVPQATPDLAAA